MVSISAKLYCRTKQHTQFGVSASNGSRDMARTKSWRKKRKKKEKNNEANWMVSNSAQLDRRTKQHTQIGVSASNGSRDMGRTKSWRKKKKKEKKKMNVYNPIKHPLRGSLNNNNNLFYIPWPFPPVWGVAYNTKKTTKQWGLHSYLLAMTRDPVEFG